MPAGIQLEGMAPGRVESTVSRVAATDSGEVIDVLTRWVDGSKLIGKWLISKVRNPVCAQTPIQKSAWTAELMSSVPSLCHCMYPKSRRAPPGMEGL